MSPKKIIHVDHEVLALIPNFMQHREEELKELDSLIAQQDYNAIANIGHRLAGNAGSYGFYEMGTMGAALEREAKAHNLTQIKDIAAQLRLHINDIEIKGP